MAPLTDLNLNQNQVIYEKSSTEFVYDVLRMNWLGK